MRLTSRRHGLFLYFVLAFALVAIMVPAAHAATRNGAYRIDDAECYEYEDLNYTYCFSVQGVLNETITPSGNTSYVANVRSSSSSTDGDGNVLFEDSGNFHIHALTMDEVLQELGYRSRSTFLFFGETCTFSYAFHEANGQIQFEREEDSCSGE